MELFCNFKAWLAPPPHLHVGFSLNTLPFPYSV